MLTSLTQIQPTPAETLGVVLRRRRRRCGFTLDELAARTSISKAYLSLIENDRVRPPSRPKLWTLEQVLGFDAGALLAVASATGELP